MAGDSQDRPVQIEVSAGTVGLISNLTRVVAGLSTDKALTLFVAGAFGWLLYSTLQQATQDKEITARLYEESRDRERRHSDEREDKLARERDAESDRMRTWFAAQMEAARRSEAEQRERDRASLAEMVKILDRRLPPPK